MLNVTSHDMQGINVLKLQGSLDALTAPEMRTRLETLIAVDGVTLLIDLSTLTTIDSSGVALLVSVFKKLHASGGTLRLVGLQGQPREIFSFLRLDQALPLSASVDEALAATKKP